MSQKPLLLVPRLDPRCHIVGINSFFKDNFFLKPYRLKCKEGKGANRRDRRERRGGKGREEGDAGRVAAGGKSKARERDNGRGRRRGR